MTTIEHQLESALREKFAPLKLEVINESHLHAGHAGDDGSGQTHFRVRIVSAEFDGMSRIDRHRAVNAVCEPLMHQGLHAIAIEARAANEI